MRRVLVVDDDAQILRALRINLRVRNYEVDTAATGSEALTTAGRHPPDLVLLDLGLPDLDGEDSHFARDRRKFAVASARRLDRGVELVDLAGDVADQIGKTFYRFCSRAQLACPHIAGFHRGHRLSRGHLRHAVRRGDFRAVTFSLPAKHLFDAPDKRLEKFYPR